MKLVLFVLMLLNFISAASSFANGSLGWGLFSFVVGAFVATQLIQESSNE